MNFLGRREHKPGESPQDIRKRMQQLLAIPDRDRTDEEWDELVELEIRLAPGNKADASGNPPGMRRDMPGKPFSGQQKPRHPQKAKHFGGHPGNKHRKPAPKPTQ